jgi:hypothetical protein
VKYITVLIIASTLWTANATAQTVSPNKVFGRYQQVNWHVLAVTTTRDGYLWIGTALTKFALRHQSEL